MQPRVAERHFLDLRKKYGTVLAVDLVNKVSLFILFRTESFYIYSVPNFKFVRKMPSSPTHVYPWPCRCMCVYLNAWEYYWAISYCVLYLISAWRWGTLEWKILTCHAECRQWWCKVEFPFIELFLWLNFVPFNADIYCHCRYVHFDFHQVCGHVHFERLSILYDQIVDFLEGNGYGY